MQGPNEWTVTGAIKGWDVRDRLREIDIPTLVIRGRHDMSTDPIAATLVKGIPSSREVVLEKARTRQCLENNRPVPRSNQQVHERSRNALVADAAGLAGRVHQRPRIEPERWEIIMAAKRPDFPAEMGAGGFEPP